MGLFEVVEKSASGLIAFYSGGSLAEEIQNTLLESVSSYGDNVEITGSILAYSFITGLAVRLFANNEEYLPRDRNRRTLAKTL